MGKIFAILSVFRCFCAEFVAVYSMRLRSSPHHCLHTNAITVSDTHTHTRWKQIYCSKWNRSSTKLFVYFCFSFVIAIFYYFCCSKLQCRARSRLSLAPPFILAAIWISHTRIYIIYKYIYIYIYIYIIYMHTYVQYANTHCERSWYFYFIT